MVVGALLKVGPDFLDLLGDFVKQIPGLDHVAVALIGLGCAMFIIGILGTCGACCNVKCMLMLVSLNSQARYIVTSSCLTCLF